MNGLKIYADAVKEDFPELSCIVDNMLILANSRIAELEAVQQHIYHIVSTGILHQSSLSKDGLIELLKDAQEASYNAGWNSTTLTGGENE